MQRSPSTWLERTRTAKELLARNPPAPRAKLARDQEIAAAVRLSRQSLRNYLSALSFIEAVATEDETIAKTLEGYSPTALNQLARAWRLQGSSALEFVRSSPDATQAEVVAHVAKLLATHREAQRQPGPIERLSADWRGGLHDDPNVGNSGPPAGVVLLSQLRLLGIKPVSWRDLKLVAPQSSFLKSAGVSQVALAELQAFTGCSSERLRRFKFSATQAAYMFLVETPKQTNLEQIKWSAKDLLFRALSVAPLAPFTVLLTRSQEERDAVIGMMPYLPETIGTPKPTAREREQQLRQAFEYHDPWEGERLDNWRIAPALGLAVLATCPQTFWLDVFGWHYSPVRTDRSKR